MLNSKIKVLEKSDSTQLGNMRTNTPDMTPFNIAPKWENAYKINHISATTCLKPLNVI